MREEIRIRSTQILGIDPSYPPGQGTNKETMGNDPRKQNQVPWRIGDLVSLMICANFKKTIHGSYIKFEYEDDTHKNMRADIIYKNVVNEFIQKEKNEVFDDIYDPGLMWLASPYYVKKYGYDIIPKLNWDKEFYEGEELPWNDYVVFAPLMNASYNLERNMSLGFVEYLCDKLYDKFGEKFYILLPPEYDGSLNSKNINRVISEKLYDIAYIIGHSKCFIGGDTGFSHLAGSSRLKKQICIGWPKQRIKNFNYSDWPWFFVNAFSLQGQFMNQTWDMYPQVDRSITDYHEFLLENNSLNEEQIDKLITIIE